MVHNNISKPPGSIWSHFWPNLCELKRQKRNVNFSATSPLSCNQQNMHYLLQLETDINMHIIYIIHCTIKFYCTTLKHHNLDTFKSKSCSGTEYTLNEYCRNHARFYSTDVENSRAIPPPPKCPTNSPQFWPYKS